MRKSGVPCPQLCVTPRLPCQLHDDKRHACVDPDEHTTLHRCLCGFRWDEAAESLTTEFLDALRAYTRQAAELRDDQILAEPTVIELKETS